MATRADEAGPDHPVVGDGHGQLAEPDGGAGPPALPGLRALDGVLPGAVRDRATRLGERRERYQRAGAQPDGHRLQVTAVGRPEGPGGRDKTDRQVPAKAKTLGTAARRAERRGDAPHGQFRGLCAVQGGSFSLCL